ncbi:MAG TPA: nuclear transport factor 2 family protein [Blastocatellia bacterium]|nr:nuclear transport factor 2 family protein [Blastocatellia bacterium]
MKTNNTLRSVLASGIIFLVAVSSGAQTKGAAAKSAPDAEFKELIEGYYAAWSTLNAENPAKYYAKDADLIFYDIAPLKYNDWAEYKEGVKKAFFDVMSSAKLTPNMNDLKVTRRGNMAWTTVTFHLSAVPKAGGSMELDGRHTAIWEKRAGRWVIVHEHVSAPLPG